MAKIMDPILPDIGPLIWALLEVQVDLLQPQQALCNVASGLKDLEKAGSRLLPKTEKASRTSGRTWVLAAHSQ